MPNRTQQDLDAVWNSIVQGKSASTPSGIVPLRIPTNDGTDIMSIPNDSGAGRDVYQRKIGSDWEQLEYVGATVWPMIKEALENPKYKWRTVEGVSAETAIDAATVLANLLSHPEQVVKSVLPDKQGHDLFTTRHHYREMSTALERLASAFTNRVQK